MKKRVICKYDDSYGTAVQSYSRDRYRVEWDEPTPYQAEAKVPIPSQHFDWADV